LFAAVALALPATPDLENTSPKIKGSHVLWLFFSFPVPESVEKTPGGHCLSSCILRASLETQYKAGQGETLPATVATYQKHA